MKFAIVFAIATGTAVNAIAGFPNCATECLLPAVQSAAPDCPNPLDFDCVCKHKAELTAQVKPCVEKKCSPSDVRKYNPMDCVLLFQTRPSNNRTEATIDNADKVCAGKGGDKPSTSAAPTESKPAETSSAAPGTESSAAPTETMPTVSETAPVGTDCPPTTMVPTTTPAGNTTAPTSAPVTAGAAGMGSVGAMVAMALGALAL